ncbi:hypothetical protein G7Y89_g7974 [Cudoniella acicularis]|uniref:SET domain-containing protein n=1 Tax=Cudoniella acicularis TaxID=354080 RepID=A0A8H4RJZ1_9HELO|nr:hypothetical protein G7Y89_g7974 [Cudoniella acicularis]
MPPKTSQAVKLPKNWPPEIRYLTSSTYTTLNVDQIASLRLYNKDFVSFSAPEGPCSLVRITPITSLPHPALGQSGLFAASNLAPGTFILQYLGEVHVSRDNSSSTTLDPHARSDYDLSLDRELGLGIDAERAGNEARFINDYRGIAERPNAEFKEIWDERTKLRGMAVWVLPEGKSGRANTVDHKFSLQISYQELCPPIAEAPILFPVSRAVNDKIDSTNTAVIL